MGKVWIVSEIQDLLSITILQVWKDVKTIISLNKRERDLRERAIVKRKKNSKDASMASTDLIHMIFGVAQWVFRRRCPSFHAGKSESNSALSIQWVEALILQPFSRRKKKGTASRSFSFPARGARKLSRKRVHKLFIESIPFRVLARTRMNIRRGDDV